MGFTFLAELQNFLWDYGVCRGSFEEFGAEKFMGSSGPKGVLPLP